MEKFLKTLLVSSMSVALLAGCSDDKKDDYTPPLGQEGEHGQQGPNGPAAKPGEDGDLGGTGPEGSVGQFAVLYGQNPDSAFQLTAVDKDDKTFVVDSEGEVELENVTTRPLHEGERDNGLNIVIENGKGSILTETVNSQGVDRSAVASNGILQFDIKVNNNDYKDKAVLVEVIDDNAYTAQLDFTSAMNAFTGAASQNVSIPLNCFEGIDFTKIVQPFSLVSEADVNFDLSNVRYVREMEGETGTLACSSDSEVLAEAETALFVRADGKTSGLYPRREHWNEYSTGYGWLDDALQLPNTNDQKAGITGDVGIILRLANNDLTKDISQFIESGTLSLDLKLESTGGYQNADMEIWFSTADIENDEDSFGTDETRTRSYVFTDLGNEWNHLNVPLRDIFADENGSIDLDKVQNLENIVLKTLTSEEAELESPVFRFTNMYLNRELVDNPM